MSRVEQPKQLIPFIHGADRAAPRTLLEIAADRLEGLVPDSRRYICTGERYRAAIREALPAFTDDRILGEPTGRDTLNAVGFGAAVFSLLDDDAVFAVLTADHIISPQETFVTAMDAGFRLVERDPTRLVSFGIKPTHPATGYGYIEKSADIVDDADDYAGLAFQLARFVEKPPLEKAKAYLAAGTFSWNAGLFVFHAKTFMRLLEQHQPESHSGLHRIGSAWSGPRRQATIDEVYPTLPKTSVDYGIMEPAATDPAVTLCGVRMDVDWLDVGSWTSYGDTVQPDAHGNRSAGAVIAAHDARGNIAVSSVQDHTIALVGCENLIVVHTDDATLVMPRDHAQDIKKLHEQLPSTLK